MDFDLDISQINFSDDPDRISLAEIVSVLKNGKSRLKEVEGYPKELFYSVETGYSNKKRILLIASRLIENKRQILQIKVADENEIEVYYCKG
ncbi:MAG: hypothetical protein ACKVOQ_16550 [Cyclobacteriaceae bacterium]